MRTLRIVIWGALAYGALGMAGLCLAIPPGYASPVFPAAGFALTCVLWFGNRALPAVWLGSAMLNLFHAWLGGSLNPASASVAAVIATGAMVQAGVGCRLVNRWQGPAWRQMEREQDAIGFLLLGGVLAGVLSATISVAGLKAVGLIEGPGVLFTWWNWYVGDVLGVLVFAPLTLSLLNTGDELWRERRRRTLVPMLLTLTLVVAAFYGASQWERQVQERQLHSDGDRIAELITDRLITHREVLSSLRHFIEALPEFTFRQFEQFTRATLHDNPDIFALSYNDLVSDADRSAFEQRMSGLSPPGSYRITERDGRNQLVRAAVRPEYVAVRYIVPLERNLPAVGYDIYSESIRRDAIERARASNGMAVTAPIRLVQERRQRTGVLELLPVYGAAARGGLEQEDRLLGFAVGVVKIDEMIEIATRNHVTVGLVFQLTDPMASNGQALLYRSDAAGAAGVPPSLLKRWKTLLRMGDRDWELSVHTTESYRRQHRPWVAWAVGLTGLILAALLQILMLGMTGRAAVIQRKNRELKAGEEALRDLNAHLERKVEERTAELAAAQDQTEKALVRVAKSEALFRAMVEQAPLGVALADSVTARLYEANEHYEKITGRTREELLSTNWTQITHPDDIQEQRDKAVLLNAGKITGYQMNKRYIRPDGSQVWTSLTVAPVVVEAGENPLHLAMIEDITERREADERLRCITDSAHDGILMMNPQGLISYWNPAAEKILGYRPEEALGKDLHELLAPERYLADFHASFPEFVRTGQGNAVGKALELFARHKDGREITVAVSLSAVSLKGAWHAVGIVRDITRQRELEESLRAAKQAAEAATQAKSDFLAGMSHEIRTPMNAIIGMADLLGETDLSPEQKKYVDIFRSAGENLLTIINDILDISKVEAGRIQLENVGFDLVGLLHTLCEVMAVRARQKGLELVCNVKPNVPTRLLGDPARLSQVLMNLIGNAVKFTDRGRVAVEVSLSETMPAVPTAGKGGVCRLDFSVSDTGIGIPSEKKESIFERFSQADSSITRKYGGTGLGLSISRHLVELMGGGIRVESRVGEGSTFSFTARFEMAGESTEDLQPGPRDRETTKAVGEPEAIVLSKPVDLSSGANHRLPLRVLLVEDSQDNQVLIEAYLRKTPCRIDIAENGQVAVDKFISRTYDMVLMDMEMPVMDGYTATREIRKLEKRKGLEPVPILALTAYVLPEETRRSIEAGCNAHLTKPIKKAALLEAIAFYTSNTERERDRPA